MTDPRQPSGSEFRDAIRVVGGSFALFSQRLMLLAFTLIGGLLLGALFRALGLQSLNYALMLLYLAAAALAAFTPAHLILIAIAGGTAAATGNAGRISSTITDYARLCARILMIFLVPLFMFASAGGDTSFATSMKAVFLFGFILMALFATRRSFRILHNMLFYMLPVGALVMILANMWIPQSTLASLGIPAWMRVSDPAAEELAELENDIAAQANEERAQCLREARRQVAAGTPMLREQAECMRRAQAERTDLITWVGSRFSAGQSANSAEPQPGSR
jgi:hypothetical protein